MELFEQTLQTTNIPNELQHFINSTPTYAENPLEWWLNPSIQEQYPCLSHMGIDIVSIHLMSADSERVFSGSRRMVTWERARLGTPTIERNECLKSWQKS
jgi:hypothetical protein